MVLFGFTDRASDQTSMDWRALLAHHPVFSCLSEAELAELLAAGTSWEKEAPSGSEIVRQGGTGDTCFLVGEGSLLVELDADGERVTLSTLRKGDIFGEIAVCDRRRRSATVTAVEDCVLLEIDGEAVREMVVGHPDLELALLVSLTGKVRTMNDRLVSLRLRDPDEA
jgi:CRP-like cAMP-binding protein